MCVDHSWCFFFWMCLLVPHLDFLGNLRDLLGTVVGSHGCLAVLGMPFLKHVLHPETEKEKTTENNHISVEVRVYIAKKKSEENEKKKEERDSGKVLTNELGHEANRKVVDALFVRGPKLVNEYILFFGGETPQGFERDLSKNRSNATEDARPLFLKDRFLRTQRFKR